MFKKYLLTAALSLAFLPGFSAPAEAAPEQQPATEAVASLPDGQTEMTNPDWPEDGGTVAVEESEIARKMTQAEKAKNAAENDSWGGAITLIAMTIVIGALVVLTILFLIFGKVSSTLLSRKKLEAHGITKEEAPHDHEDVDSGEAIAAIALALSQHLEQRHDIEDTILTIRRMKKAYSPWNSKIYNLRELPELHRNPKTK